MKAWWTRQRVQQRPLVRAALAVLEPLYRDENALEPERVSEKLHQKYFLVGRRRFDHSCDQRN